MTGFCLLVGCFDVFYLERHPCDPAYTGPERCDSADGDVSEHDSQDPSDIFEDAADSGMKMWSIRTIEENNVNDLPYIALDNNNFVHIAYPVYDNATAQIKHVTSLTSWSPETVDTSTSGPGTRVALAIDSADQIHISYFYLSPYLTPLKYARYNGSWVIVEVEPDLGSGFASSMAMDHLNAIYVAYFIDNGSFHHLRCKTYKNGISSVILDEAMLNDVEALWMVIDSANKFHISYFELNFLKYVTNRSGSWTLLTIAELAANSEKDLSMAIGADDLIYTGYYDSADSSLKYAKKAADNLLGPFDVQTVETGLGANRYDGSWLTVDASNALHITYQYSPQNGQYELRYTTNASGTWKTAVVEKGSAKIPYSSIAVDSNQQVHVSYLVYNHDSTGSLKYAIKAAE